MLAKRIIPCLDVKKDQVIKGVQFKNHEIVGDILDLAEKYSNQGADELVFYDITASSDQSPVKKNWIQKIAEKINIPFCVAGGIKTIEKAEEILNFGADKISINSPALENPNLITTLVKRFGSQCVVVGIDSLFKKDDYYVYKYTGRVEKMQFSKKRTLDWILEVEERGAGEIVLNCMNQDGMKQGYDIEQLQKVKEKIKIPLVASGGAGQMLHFKEVFEKTGTEAALAASVFHKNLFSIQQLKQYLKNNNIQIRL